LNFAENLLYPACISDEKSFAVIAVTEVSREHVSWRELRERVRRCTHALRGIGIKEGDRVAGYVANHTNALVAMLASTAIGALWTGVSPDTGVHAVLDRVQQIEPAVLFCDNAAYYNGKIHDVESKVHEIVRGLPDLQAVVVFPAHITHEFNYSKIKPLHGQTWKYEDFVATNYSDKKQEFAQLPPDHPIYILYSSGTTGKPKAIVHSAAGTLIQHKKEHTIHCDIHPGDRLFYFTTCTWMMWHWLVSGLASGATLILYDGSPFRPLDESGTGDMAMARLIEEFQITHFGTSAMYLSVLEQKAVMPKEKLQLKFLKAIYSTGSPLAPSTFEYVYRVFGPNINLGSITGGTDIISLFGAPSLITPVYTGEIQVRGLGMAVEVWDFEGKDITNTGEPGDLVCTMPFPSQPVYFWGPEGQKMYKRSYFDVFPGVWHHGDFVRINPETGGMIMLGRSDGTLKPSGVRFGSAEIYNILLQYFPEVEDALCIGRRRETDTDETVILFLKMAAGETYSEALVQRIRSTIRSSLSPRHVPAIINECFEIPITVNGKK
jgi:acetoacetyl-CoA synthetase